MTKHELAQLVLTPEELKRYDVVLPQDFVDDCDGMLNIDPRPFYVWVYDDNSPIGGRPVNLAGRFFLAYQNAPELWDAAKALFDDAVDRGEVWDRDAKGETMYDYYLYLSHALDAIQIKKEELLNQRKK